MAAIKLSVTAAQHVSGLTKEKGKQSLTKYLGWPELDEEGDMRQCIHLDYLYDVLMFCVDKGFSWENVCLVIEISNQLLMESIGKSLTETLTLFKLKSADLSFLLDERNHKAYVDYMFLTFMRHYKLIQLVFMYDRTKQVPSVNLKIETPTTAEPLKTAQDIKMWEYQKKYEALTEKEVEKAREIAARKEAILKEAEKRKLQTMQQISQTPLTKETVEQIMRDVLQTQTSTFVENMKCKIDEVQGELELKLEKTSIPRPQALGPPPRFNLKPKTPLPTPVGKTPKSSKADRKGSGSTRSSRSRASKS